MKALRLASLILCGAALLACVAGVVAAAYFAPPHDLYHLSGLVLRGVDTGATLSHRSLACADAANPLLTTCRATVDGRELVVSAVHEARPRWGFQSCSVAYDGRTAPCRAGNIVVNGPLVASVDGAALGLAAADLRAIRQAHPIENWREADWQRLPLILAELAALALALAGLNAPAPHWLGRVAVAAGGGLTAFVVAYAALGVWIFSLGYID